MFFLKLYWNSIRRPHRVQKCNIHSAYTVGVCEVYVFVPSKKKSQILLLENSKKNINIWFPLCHSRQSRPKLKFKMSSQLITTYKSLKNTSQVLKMAQSRRVQKFCIHSRSMLVPSKNVQILLHENSKKEKNINSCFPLCHNWQPRPKLKCKNELSLHAKP